MKGWLNANGFVDHMKLNMEIDDDTQWVIFKFIHRAREIDCLRTCDFDTTVRSKCCVLLMWMCHKAANNNDRIAKKKFLWMCLLCEWACLYLRKNCFCSSIFSKNFSFCNRYASATRFSPDLLSGKHFVSHDSFLSHLLVFHYSASRRWMAATNKSNTNRERIYLSENDCERQNNNNNNEN